MATGMAEAAPTPSRHGRACPEPHDARCCASARCTALATISSCSTCATASTAPDAAAVPRARPIATSASAATRSSPSNRRAAPAPSPATASGTPTARSRGNAATARVASRRGWCAMAPRAAMPSFSTARPARMHVTRLAGGRYAIAMGVPQFAPQSVPLLGYHEAQDSYALDVDGQSVQFGAVSMGNPHALVEVDDIAARAGATAWRCVAARCRVSRNRSTSASPRSMRATASACACTSAASAKRSPAAAAPAPRRRS